MQAVVDRQKRFLDVAIGMPDNIHDSRMLLRSALYQQDESGTLFDPDISIDSVIPYLLGDAGYLTTVAHDPV
jgi:hypothetical protein